MYENVVMIDLPNFHDGYFDGLWTSENKVVHLFLRTSNGERSTIVLSEVERLNTTNFTAGNIILDVVVVKSHDLTIAAIEQLYQFSPHRQNSPNNFSERHGDGGFWRSKSIRRMGLSAWLYFGERKYCQTMFCLATRVDESNRDFTSATESEDLPPSVPVLSHRPLHLSRSSPSHIPIGRFSNERCNYLSCLAKQR
jgi:hypothetical protein